MDSVFVFAAALTLYRATLAPAVIWGDSATLATDAFEGSIHLTTAGDHPLFVLVGRWFSALPGDVARNINLASAVFGALTVMLVYRCARRLGTSRLAAALGAAALCVSHAFWLHSVIAEVYTANAFFLAATLTLLCEWEVRRHPGWLLSAAAVFATGLTNHLVLATMAPAAVAFVVMRKGRTLLTRGSLVGLAVLLAVVLVLVLALPDRVAAQLRALWDGPPGIGEYLGLNVDPRATAREAGYYVLYLVYQFPSVSLLFGVVGAVALLRNQPAVAVLLLFTVVVNAATFVRHTVWPSVGNQKYVFYIADYVVFSILCAVGADKTMSLLAARLAPHRTAWMSGTLVAAVALVPPLLYTVIPSTAKAAGLDLVHARTLPYRDNDRFFLNPNKRGEDGARRFGEETLRLVKPGAVIFADYTPFAVLRYLQVVERRRPDVKLAGPRAVSETVPVEWTFEGDRRRPTYVAALTPGYYDLSGLTGRYELAPAGPIIEVCPR